MAERPEKREQPGKAKSERQRHENDEDFHHTSLNARSDAKAASNFAGRALPPAFRARNAFSMTRIEDPDIAAATIKSVTIPEIAIGTASKL